MTREEAIQILTPMKLMLSTPDGKPISDAYYALEIAIEALKQTAWIPCSERLPEKDGRYLCTYSDFGTCVDFGLYTDEQWIIEPVAWMPLPQPWKEVEDEFYNRNA